MADYLQILQGVTAGLDAGQRFRANKQFERARDQDLESGEYDLEQRRALRRTRDPDTASVLGPLDPNSVQDFQGLGDPFGIKLIQFFKNKAGQRRKKRALAGAPAAQPDPLIAPEADQQFGGTQSFPVGAFGDEVTLPQFADGGQVSEEELQARRAERLRVAEQQGEANARRAAETSEQERLSRVAAYDALPKTGGIPDEMRQEIARRQNRESFTGSAGLDTAINRTLSPTLGPGVLPGTDTTPRRGGPVGPRSRPRQALPIEQGGAGAAPDPAAATAGAGPATASPPAAAAPRSAIPARAAAPSQGAPQGVDFSQLDVDPKEVPDMKTDDWRVYRAQVADAARKSGRPEAVAQANEMVTRMQQQGFLNYGQQGLALQQAGNLKGAMAAYRAAFQYFPNGNDVEFGLVRGRDGKPVIVGFGKDEQTGERVEGSEMVLDIGRASQLLENFTNPGAFRAWTKDWRDFEEGKRRFDAQQAGVNQDRNLREREYNEVRKPLAQAQADSLANRSEADILRAQGQGGGALSPRDLQGSERTFRDRVGLLGVTDEAQADFLASAMSQIKKASPNTPDNTIVNAVMRAQQDGTLQERLNKLGIR